MNVYIQKAGAKYCYPDTVQDFLVPCYPSLLKHYIRNITRRVL